MKTSAVISFFAATAFAVRATTPAITSVTMSQADASRLVTIGYTLAGADAVVTLDIETNAVANAETGWTSIGGEAVSSAIGDVWRKVATGAHTITWRPDRTWPDHVLGDGCARAVVTAWATNNTPDYMVVDISAAASANSEKYYPGADYIPGGLLSNDDYRTTKIVMRKIMAEGVTFTMGSTTLETQDRDATREKTHDATLDSNYYIGVFEVTQSQWELLAPARSLPSRCTNVVDRAMRPVEYVCFNEIRNNSGTTANDAYDYPNAPNSASYIGKLRTRTGIDFDLPGEAQWEWACRAGHGVGMWGNGSAILNTSPDANLSMLGRYAGNAPSTSNSDADRNVRASAGGTAIVGSYSPNDWGLYDMNGNVQEWCLDYWWSDISSLNGAIAPAEGKTSASRVRRGGCFTERAGLCRPAYRNASGSTKNDWFIGFRLACPVSAK